MNSIQATGTLGRLVSQAITRYPHRDCMSDGTLAWTYEQFGKAVAACVARFASLGLKRGDGIAVLSGNRVEVFALLCAASLSGIRYTPLHPLSAEEEHAFVLEDCEASLLLFDARKFVEHSARLRERVPSLAMVRSIGSAPDVEPFLVGDYADYSGPAALTCVADSEDIAYLTYTGGTTGRSKGVMLSHRSLVTMSAMIVSEWDWPQVPRYGVATPVSHAGGINMFPILSRGGYVRVMDGFDAAKFCAIVEAERLNCTLLVPTLIGNLVDAEDARAGRDLSSLELIIYGAAPISPDRLREAMGIFGPVFLQLYGQSEFPQCVCTLRKVDHDLENPKRLESCGMVNPLTELRLLDPDLNEVPVGEVGEICLRGPMMMSGYWRQPELTAEAMRGGWLHTGDLARRDAEGYIYIVDRTKDMIISGGFNIYPREVEDALMSHSAVALAGVVGIPHPKWGEAVAAFVTLREGQTVSEEELIGLVKQLRGGPWAPKRVTFLDQLPLTGLGKLDRKALRAPFWEGRARSVS